MPQKYTTGQAICYLEEHPEARFEAPDNGLWHGMTLHYGVKRFVCKFRDTNRTANVIPKRSDWELVTP